MTQESKLSFFARRWSCVLPCAALTLSCSQFNRDVPPDAIAGTGQRSDAAGAADAPLGSQGTAGGPGGGGGPLNDVANCGLSARDCTRLANVRAGASVQCQDGHCVVPTTACVEGYGHCTLNPDDGCETNLTRAENCGACGVACSGTASLCASVNGRSQCTSTCGTVTPDMCGASCTNLQTNPENCGTCGQSCSFPNTQAKCVAGHCAVATCNTGFADCNGNPGDGCEASLSRAETCGSCTVSCSGTAALCANMGGRFQCTSSCAPATPDNCGTVCTNLQTDADNCGKCGHLCSLPNAQARCVAGSCAVASCNPGFGDCNSTPADGCEASLSRAETCGSCTVSCSGTTMLCANMSGRFQCGNSCAGATPNNCGARCANLQTDAQNCGTCGHACSLPNAQARCVAGSCAVATCNPGFGDCNSNPADGCEASLSQPQTCGSCTVSCSGTTAQCANMSGRFQCASSCAGATPDNCQTRCANLQNDVQNCGTCGHVCSLPNAQARCVAGSCAVASCNPGFDDCNSNPMDGCEASLSRPQTCGSCTVSCSGTTAQCANMNGRFACANSCAGATPDNCQTACVNLQNDVQNCGRCGQRCSLPNAQARCAAGICAIASCNQNFDDCNANPMDGCEASLSRPQTCGSCTRSCSGTMAQCANMGGTFGCANSCAGPTPDNCQTVCVNLQNDVQHCGSCTHPCNLPNAQARCAAGMCAIASCNQNFDDCNGNPTDGCEASLSRPQTCGSCAVSCSGTMALCANVGGRFACANSCVPPTPDNCQTACVDLQKDVQNCGRCGQPCMLPNAQALCVAGRCTVGSCNSGFHLCTQTQSCKPNDQCCDICGVTACAAGACIPDLRDIWDDNEGDTVAVDQSGNTITMVYQPGSTKQPPGATAHGTFSTANSFFSPEFGQTATVVSGTLITWSAGGRWTR
jgi:hypothetical protein